MRGQVLIYCLAPIVLSCGRQLVKSEHPTKLVTIQIAEDATEACCDNLYVSGLEYPEPSYGPTGQKVPFDHSQVFDFEVRKADVLTVGLKSLASSEVCAILDQKVEPGNYRIDLNQVRCEVGIYVFTVHLSDTVYVIR